MSYGVYIVRQKLDHPKGRITRIHFKQFLSNSSNFYSVAIATALEQFLASELKKLPGIKNCLEFQPIGILPCQNCGGEIGGVAIYRVEVQPVSGSGNYLYFSSGSTRQQQQQT
ncbi:hypothetical protein TNCV_2622331 [Trichonephila clavipes]|uniref:Uncharacterized protein n=1 Tax=Trichonephila clavipes TaxID=2585209 RepID=A0A8X6WDI4_TRICX|nr:hypothetical protein TNCV_2622331 [Trichonephila clavipes]